MSSRPETPIDPETILKDIFGAGSRGFEIVRQHGEQVAAHALRAASGLKTQQPDEHFLYEAAMLHDIGVYETATPQLDCHGRHPYICHGIIGRRMLEDRGLPQHALVCERHVGVGLTIEEIRTRDLPLPARDMRPVTIEEELICYADKFYSKTNGRPTHAKSVPEIVHKLNNYGRHQAKTFIHWAARFEGVLLDPDDV